MPWQMTDSMLATRHSQSSFSGIANCVSPSQAPTTDRKAGSKHKGKARFSRLCGVLRWIAYDLSGPYRTRTCQRHRLAHQRLGKARLTARVVQNAVQTGRGSGL